MTRITISRAVATVGVALALGAGVAAAASAQQDPGPASTVGTAVLERDHGATARGPAAIHSPSVPRQGPPSYNSWPHGGVFPEAPAEAADTEIDLDVAQLGAGALGGALLAGAVTVVVASSRGRRRAAHA